MHIHLHANQLNKGFNASVNRGWNNELWECHEIRFVT